jgi:acetolactate synthase I/II/III large subunit
VENRTGAEVLAEMLEGYGVTHFFFVPAILRMTLREMERRTSITPIATHGEKAAAYMADGYARASKRPGLCAAQIVGALNLAAGLRDAWLTHSPVVALTGGREPLTKFRQPYQEVDDIPAFEPVTKMNATIDCVDRIPDMVCQAFRVAVSGTPGPVHLQFRGNCGQMDEEPTTVEPLTEPRFSQAPPFRPAPDASDVKMAVRCLEEAERPLIVAGGGVRASGAGREIVALAERLGVPIATSLNGKDSIPGAHPLSVGVLGTYSRETANQAALRCDLVCFVGSETGGMVTDFWRVPPIDTPAVQVDINPEVLGRNYQLRASVLGDAKISLQRMLEQANTFIAADRHANWLSEISRICTLWRQKYHSLMLSDDTPIRPERICHELTHELPDDALVVVDTGHAGMWMGGFYDLKGPDQGYIRSGGHLGWAFPAGIGAKCAAPDRPVVVFTGDAGFWYHIGEIETAVRYNIRTVTVVNNNSGGNQAAPDMDRIWGGAQTDFARGLWRYTDVNLARIAEDMGAIGIRVDSPVALSSAISRALTADRPVIIDVVTDVRAQAPTALH